MMSRTHIAGGAFAAGSTLLVARASGCVNISDGAILVGTIIGMFASEFPDIDHPKSRVSCGGGSLYRFLPFGRILSVLAAFPAQVLGLCVREKWNHRGPTHSLIFAGVWAVIAAPIYSMFLFLVMLLVVGVLRPVVGSFLLPFFKVIHAQNVLTGSAVQQSQDVAVRILDSYWLVAVAVFVGYFSHLVLDGLTKVPVPFLWPMKTTRYSLLPHQFQISTDSTTERCAVRPFLIVATVCSVGIFSFFPFVETTLRKTSGIQPATLRTQKHSFFSTSIKLEQCQSHHHLRKSRLCKEE